MKASNLPFVVLSAADDVDSVVDLTYRKLCRLRDVLSTYVDDPSYDFGDDVDLVGYLKDVEYAIQDVVAFMNFKLY